MVMQRPPKAEENKLNSFANAYDNGKWQMTNDKY